MSLIDKRFVNLPEYSNDMHKAYGPAEVMYAFRKKMHERYLKMKEDAPGPTESNKLKIVTEVKVKK